MRGFQNCACDVVATDTEGAGEKQGGQKRRTRKENKRTKEQLVKSR
jgi:hypothetical protein